MSEIDYSKSLNLLHIFERLQRGEVIKTKEEMKRFNVSRKTIQRYIGSLREYLADFYFYLIAYMSDRDYDHPTVFRVDRINGYTVEDENFSIPYLERFKPGEFRKRVQFMFNGELSRIEFKYYSKNIEHILDRLPTAEVIEETDDGCIIKAEVYSEYGLKIWLLSQGKNIEVLRPKSLRQELQELIKGMLEVYK
ncbi:WYL domain-containing protein [Selenihalanaerobacter shriftii]|uniref:HTH domain-containing protein n=1 Tax=Selenihalanaerobacter shriftii TaxID=142842 RepID=A0A1T4NDS1_9FIRM|nr:WYL domain-containing protein [Selenihalanaerobacter shriftii]SJZ77412.1 HTH domain-containing protein [Selenihalanaerobacter shriftii]